MQFNTICAKVSKTFIDVQRGVGHMGNLAEKINQLPEQLQQEVEDFVDFLAKKHTPGKKKKLLMKWAGVLGEYRDQFTSLELQKKSLNWWNE
jgi:hypothetical protein